MVIIWQGLGFIVAIVPVLAFGLTEMSVKALFEDATYSRTHNWPNLAALAIAGAVLLLIGKCLNKLDGEVLIEKGTGREIVSKAPHTLFFINVEYWGYILLVAGGLSLLFSLVRAAA